MPAPPQDLMAVYFLAYYLLILILPPLLNAMTDIAMEGVQFPINFYLMYGYFLSQGINLKKEKLNI